MASDDARRNGDSEAEAAAAATRAEVAADQAHAAAEEAEAAANVAEDSAREARKDADGSDSDDARTAAAQAETDAESARKAATEARAVAAEADREAQLAAGFAEKGDSIPAKAAAAAAETAAFIAQADAENAQEYAEEAHEEEIRAEKASWRPPAMRSHSGGDGGGGHGGGLGGGGGNGGDTVPSLYLAEFDTTHEVLHAAETVRDAGFKRWDVHTPFPIHGMDDAMGLGQSRLGWIVMAMGLTGCIGGFVMMMWMNGIDYPLVIGGKPPESIPSMIPIIFECTILLSGIGAVFGMLGLNGLPRHHHPVFHSTRFEACSDDKFFISVEAADPNFDLENTRELLESLRPSHLELVEEVAP